MTTGQRMRIRRKEIGLSAERVAEILGVSPATIYRYENGDIEKVPGDSLGPIAAALHTTPDYLMGWSDNPQPSQTDTPVLSAAEQELIHSFRSLNPEGQQKVLDYTADLSASGRYIKTTSDNTIPKQA